MKNRILMVLGVVFIVGGGWYYMKGRGGDNRKLIAEARGVKIYDEDFTKELVGLPPAYRSYVSTLEGKKQLLDILLREKLLLSVAEKSGAANKKEVVASLKEYQDRMKEQESEYRKNLVLREFLREMQDGDLKVSDAEIKSYYDANSADYKNPTKMTVSHILLPSQEEAEKVLALAKKGGDFAQLARSYSTDPSASKGGLIGEVQKGDLADLPEFEQELLKLKNGGISGVVKTKIGYHIIKKTGEMHLPPQTFEKVAPQIRRLLEKKKFDQWISQIKTQENVQIHEELLSSIRIPPMAEPQPESQNPAVMK